MFDKITSWWGTAPVPPPPSETTTPAKPVNPLNPQGLKPCCACPETKSARDACFLNTDGAIAEEKCKALVAAHIKCMRGYGFDV